MVLGHGLAGLGLCNPDRWITVRAMTNPRPADAEIAATIMTLVEARGSGKSICPSEAARALADVWQPLMGPVRQVAIGLASAGHIDILRKGRPVALGASPADDIRGVIRLRLRPAGDAS